MEVFFVLASFTLTPAPAPQHCFEPSLVSNTVQCTTTYMHHFKSLALIDSLQYIIHYLKCTPRHFSFRTQITAVQVHFKTQCVHSLHISKAALLKVFISWTSKCEIFSVKGIFTISSTKKTIILYFALSVSTGKIVSSVQKVIISSGSKYCMYRI